MSQRLRCAAMGALVTAAMIAPATVAAQQDRQAQSVAQRNAPEFTRRPLRAGAFELFPSIQVDTEYNDNVFALPNNEIDDAIIFIRPELLVRRGTPTSETRVQLQANIRQFLDINTEDSEQYTGSISTRQGVGTGTEWGLNASVSQNFEQRREIDSFNEAGEPVTFVQYRAGANVTQDFGPLRVNVGGSARAVRYDGVFEEDGLLLDLSFRDFEVYQGQARASFRRSENQEIYLQVTADTRRFQLAPLFVNGLIVDVEGIDRSSRGGRVELGYRRQLTELLNLDLRAGYFLQDFDDPDLNNTSGLAFQGDVLWNATPLTSVRFSGVRQVDQSVNPQFNGVVRTEARVQVEHELRRNIILIGRAGFADFNRLESTNDGDQYTIGVQAEYLISRPWRLTFDAEHFNRGGFVDFEQNTARLGVRYNF